MFSLYIFSPINSYHYNQYNSSNQCHNAKYPQSSTPNVTVLVLVRKDDQKYYNNKLMNNLGSKNRVQCIRIYYNNIL